MSYIRTSSDRKYSKGGIMYVFLSGSDDGKVEWMSGSPENPEDLAEIICRVVSQAGIELSDSDVDAIRDCLGLDELDEPETFEPPTDEEFEEMIEELDTEDGGEDQ